MNSFTEKVDDCPTCEYEENLSVLRSLEFFSGLPAETLKVFAYLCVREKLKAGDYLFRQHEEADKAVYVISGTAGLFRETEGGETKMREYGAEDFLGGLGLMGGNRCLYSLKAISDMVCLVIIRDKFSVALEQFPELKEKVISRLIARIRSWEEQLLVRYAQNLEGLAGNVGVSLV